MNRSVKITLSLLALLLGTSCAGYQLGPVKSKITEKINTIAVPTFKNDTLEPRLSVLVTNAAIAEFQNDGSFRIVRSKDADAILQAKIRRIQRFQARGGQIDTLNTQELRVVMEVEWELLDGKTQLPILKSKSTGETTIFRGRNFTLSLRSAYAVAARRTAESIVTSLSEGTSSYLKRRYGRGGDEMEEQW